ncbi:Pfam:DUF894 [Seminavis robusta]|uniref:Pfam:DUF894 n=1 Tax=Seminavis robusta TaxID=568900 RepID=A0A9N8DK17_9STRA|nr:Pfam:DUF894 [Seminavis robusta]|eukprot:Sro164_g073640.1 Pfam:DUF894 (571) ;mRNA; f:57867-59799
MGITMETPEGLPLTTTLAEMGKANTNLRSDSFTSTSSGSSDEEAPAHKNAAQHADDGSLERSDSGSFDNSSNGNEDLPFFDSVDSKDDDSRDNGDEEEKDMLATTTLSGYLRLLMEDVVSYIMLLITNKPFRLFLVSYVFGHMGEWFTYIASISLMERMLGDDSENSRTSLGILVAIRLLPTVVLSPFGGVLADSYDRRKAMIILDLVGAFTPIFFILATFLEHSGLHPYYGVAMIYFATVSQECVCALYEPCRASMVPLLVTGDADLKKATTLTGVAWSAVAAFGSALGGFATSLFGARTCFCLDGVCYLLSAVLMWSVGGNWKVAPDVKYESVWLQIKGMTVDGGKYLSTSFFGGLVFFKATCALVTGATNVLNVSLSERDTDDSIWFISEMDTEQKLGILFSITGIGCILGPLVSDPLTNIEQPKALQLACVFGFVAVTLGCLGVGLFSPFWAVCVFSAVRSAGMGILWLDSQFLLQKFTAKEMLGRVAAVDDALATLSEALSSLLCGFLQDEFHLSAMAVSKCRLLWVLGLQYCGPYTTSPAEGQLRVTKMVARCHQRRAPMTLLD